MALDQILGSLANVSPFPKDLVFLPLNFERNWFGDASEHKTFPGTEFLAGWVAAIGRSSSSRRLRMVSGALEVCEFYQKVEASVSGFQPAPMAEIRLPAIFLDSNWLDSWKHIHFWCQEIQPLLRCWTLSGALNSMSPELLGKSGKLVHHHRVRTWAIWEWMLILPSTGPWSSMLRSWPWCWMLGSGHIKLMGHLCSCWLDWTSNRVSESNWCESHVSLDGV